MKIGAENKKALYALMVFGPIAAYMVYSQFFSGPSYKPSTPPPVRGDASEVTPAVPAAPEKSSGPDISRAENATARPSSRGKIGEFHPKVRSKKKEEQVAIADVDPTIRFDLLDRAMKVPPAGGERDLFQILKSPPVKETAAAVLQGPGPKVPLIYGPRQPLPPPGPAPPPPPPPPAAIPFKYFGYSAIHPDGKRTAYFLDGDEILEAKEGDVLKGRWRIVQIGLDKVLVENTQEKRRQPLNIEPELTG